MISWKKPDFSDPFYRQIKKLVIPIVIQNLLSATVNSTDVVMLNYVGQSAISAVSLAAQYATILFMFYYGLGTGATMLCAQYYGKKDFKAIRMVEGVALRFSVAASCAFALLAVTIPELLMKVFTNDMELIAIGASYLRILSVCYLCWGVIEIYLAVLRSIGQVAVSTALNALAFVLNIILNAVFIFGLFGAPRLGVVGVAIATSASRVVELVGCVIVSLYNKEVKMKLSYMFMRNKALFSDFVKMSLPALGNDIVWGVGFSMYSVILGHLGNDAVAANSFVAVVRNFGTVLCFGMASAGGILLGNEIGEGKLEKARVDARRIMKLTVISGAVGGLLVLLVTPFVLRVADVTDLARHYLKYMLLINSYHGRGGAVKMTRRDGGCRAGGDSRFGFFCDLFTMWGYGVPLGFVAAFVFKLPVLAVYFLLCTDEFVKWPFVIRHYRSDKWLNDITREEY